MGVLLDAPTLAAVAKGRLSAVLELARLKPGDVNLSVVSQLQAETGLRLSPGAQARYGALLKDFIAAVRVLDFGRNEAQQASQLAGYLAQQGETLSGFELILASTALAHGLTLVTEDTQRYLAVPGLAVENWLRPNRPASLSGPLP